MKKWFLIRSITPPAHYKHEPISGVIATGPEIPPGHVEEVVPLKDLELAQEARDAEMKRATFAHERELMALESAEHQRAALEVIVRGVPKPKQVAKAGLEDLCLDCGKPRTAPGVPAICQGWHRPEDEE